jgi:hypothetical protein
MKEPVDNSEYFKHSEYPVRDSIFNAVVKRYGVKGNHWKRSDEFVWNGAIYYVWDYFLMVLFIWFTYWLATAMYDHYGLFKAMMVVVVMFLVRLNSLVRKVDLTNRLLRKIEEKEKK